MGITMKTAKILKKIISVILASVIMITTLAANINFVLAESEYDTGISMSKSGLVGGSISSERYSQNIFNIVNDGSNDNTTVGLWSYDISDRNNITYAELTAEVTRYSNAYIDGLNIDFYYVNPESVKSYLKDINSSSKITNISSISENAGDNSVSHIKTLFSLNERNLIGSLKHNYSTTSDTKFTLDLTTAYYEMTANNWSGICIIAMCNKNNNGINTYKWSDTWIKLGNILYTKGNKSISYNKSSVLTGGDGNARYNGNMFNIVNDGTSSCTSIGLWSYNVSDIKYINSATINMFVNNYHSAVINDLSIDFYFINSSIAASYLKPLSESNKTSTNSEFTQNMGNNSVNWAKDHFGLNDSNKIGSLNHDYSSSPSRYITLDLTNALNTAEQQNWENICIIAMCNKNNNGSTHYNWSDTWLYAGNLYYDEISTYIPFEKTGILCGMDTSSRNNGNKFNIVNDSSPLNTTVGLWSYNVTDINTDSHANIMATSSQWSQEKIDNFGIEFYLIDSNTVSGFLKNASSDYKVSQYMTILSNAGSNCASAIKANLNLNENNKVGYLAHDYTNNKNKYYNIDISSVLQTLKQNDIQNVTLVAMCNKNNNGSSSGLWSDVWLEMSGITYGADIDLALIQQLKNAMSDYENKLASGKIYKNMGSAYRAYVNAQKALDAYRYGKTTSLNIAQYLNALTSSIQSMTEWSAPNPNISPQFSSSDTGTIPLTTGCLWYEYRDDPLVTSYSAEGCNVTSNVYYQNGVYLYTDSSPNIPFTVGFYRSSSAITANPQNPRILYFSLLRQNGGLYIRNNQYTGDICPREFAAIISKSYRVNSTQNGDDNNIILSSSDMRYMANYFNINYQEAFSSDNYYVEAKATAFSEGLGNRDSGTNVNYVKYIEGFGAKTFYIINYKPILDLINSSSNRNMIKSIASYKQGGLQTLMTAYDAATAIDPTAYDFSSSTLTKVSDCATEIKNAVSKFAAVTSTSKDNAAYNILRSAIDKANSIGNQNYVISSNTTQTTRYSQESWSTYFSALNEAQSAMANVMSASGYSSTYNSKTISAIANQLNNKRDSLKYNYIIEFISTSGQNMGSIVASEEQTVDTSSIVNTPTIKGMQERQMHIVYSWTPITITREEFSQSKVITVNEVSTEEECELIPGEIITEPTCSTPGLRHSTCTVCNASYETAVEPLEHNYTSEVVPPTCYAEGYTLYTCTNCANTYKDNYTPVTEHNYTTLTVAPTCTEQGYTAQRCTVCSHEEIDENSYTEPLGHEYTCSVIRDADCTFSGVVEYVCIRHDDSYTEQTGTDDNNHPELVYSRTVAPTESESGCDIYYCNNLCGYWEKRNIVPPTSSNPIFSDYLDSYNMALETIIEDLTPYTEESKPIYTQAIANAKAQAENAIREQNIQLLESSTRTIIEASALLRIRTISINLLVCDVNGKIIVPETGTSLALYGDTVNLDISNVANGLSVEKWTVEQNGKITKVNNASTYCDINACADTYVIAYLSEDEAKQSQKKIILQNKSAKTIGIKYVNEFGNIDLSNPTLFGITAPKVPFYTFDKWEIVSNDNNIITLKATYKTILQEG